MLLYTQREDTWPITKMELEGRGVSHEPFGVCLHFFMHPLYLFHFPFQSSVGVSLLVHRWCA